MYETKPDGTLNKVVDLVSTKEADRTGKTIEPVEEEEESEEPSDPSEEPESPGVE